MTPKTLIRFGCSGAGVAGLAAMALVAVQAAEPGAEASPPVTWSDADSRYVRAAELRASDLLHATVFAAHDRAAGRIVKISFDRSGSAEWVWLRFDGMFGQWSLRTPIAGLYYDRVEGRLRTDRPLEQLHRLAAADPEIHPSTATAIPARVAPAARLMGLKIVGDRDNQVGWVHSVRAGANGGAEELVVERRFGLFHAKTERYVVPADMVSYLPVTQQLVIHDMPQPVFASLDSRG